LINKHEIGALQEQALKIKRNKIERRIW